MKTTVDIPDDVFHRAKVIAAYRKTTLKTLIVRGLRHEMDAVEAGGDANQLLIDALTTGRNNSPVGRLKRDELYDRDILRRH